VCKETKNIEEFVNDKRCKFGKSRLCKKCAREYRKKWYKENIDTEKVKRTAYMKIYNKKRRPIINKIYYHKNKKRLLEVYKKNNLKYYHNMTEDDYNIMHDAQNGKCKICGKKQERLFVDHDHETNETRGLLCNNCNTGLGMFKDNKNNLLSAIKYLDEYMSI